MATYVLRRLALFVPTMFLVAALAFGILRVVPGDAVDLILEESPHATPEEKEALREEMGLGDPVAVQFGNWMIDLAQGDLGTSFWTGRPVKEDIQDRLPATAEIALLAVLVSLVIALPLGVICAQKRGTTTDHVGRVVSVFAVSVPNFVLATLVITYSSKWFNWIPPIGFVNFTDDPMKNLQQCIVPAVVLGASMAGTISRMTRSAVLDVLTHDYIRTARAKGLGRRAVTVRHVLRNAVNPIVTVSGTQFGHLLGGTLIVEVVFAVPGLGRLAYDGILQRDYPLVQAVVLLSAVTFLTVNLAVDLSYRAFDPRVKF
jgi:peptide/nickel transport system permease protein